MAYYIHLLTSLSLRGGVFYYCGDILSVLVDVEDYFIVMYHYYIICLHGIPSVWSVSLFSPIILLLEGETTCIHTWYLF